MMHLVYNRVAKDWHFQYKDVQGPVWIHGEKCYFNSWSEAKQAATKAGWIVRTSGEVETQTRQT